MTDWSRTKCHELTLLLDRTLPDPRRIAALSMAVGLEPPPRLGVEPSFAQLSRLVRAASVAGKLNQLAREAAQMVPPEDAEELASLAPPEPEPEPESESESESESEPS